MTDQEDAKRFGEFINNFSEEEYEKYIEGEEAINKLSPQEIERLLRDGSPEALTKLDRYTVHSSDKQRDLALTVRTPVSEEEEEELDREQAYTGEQSNIREIDNIVYDNRDLPPKRINVTIEIPRDNSPIRVLPQREGTRQPIQTAQLPRTTQQPTMQQPRQVTRQPNLFRRFISRINIFRRKR